MSVTFFRVRLLSWVCRIFIFPAKLLSVLSLFGESVFFQKLSLFKQSVPLSSWIRYFFFFKLQKLPYMQTSPCLQSWSHVLGWDISFCLKTLSLFSKICLFSAPVKSQQNLFPRQEVSLCLDCVPAHRVFSSFRARFCLQNLSPVCTVWGGFPGLCLFAGPI